MSTREPENSDAARDRSLALNMDARNKRRLFRPTPLPPSRIAFCRFHFRSGGKRPFNFSDMVKLGCGDLPEKAFITLAAIQPGVQVETANFEVAVVELLYIFGRGEFKWWNQTTEKLLDGVLQSARRHCCCSLGALMGRLQ
jgi:hypothetical protein